MRSSPALTSATSRVPIPGTLPTMCYTQTALALLCRRRQKCPVGGTAVEVGRCWERGRGATCLSGRIANWNQEKLSHLWCVCSPMPIDGRLWHCYLIWGLCGRILFRYVCMQLQTSAVESCVRLSHLCKGLLLIVVGVNSPEITSAFSS